MTYIGFIGTGDMGRPMAVNLAIYLAAENSVNLLTVYSKEGATHPDLQAAGIQAAADVNTLATADVIFLCLPTAHDVEQLLFGSEGAEFGPESTGLAQQLSPGAKVIDTGTTEYQATLRINESLCKLGLNFIDAPVSGMKARAEDGTLTMMCGGESELIDSVAPLLGSMASKIISMGPVGSGQLAKLINQLLFDINAAALAEILPLAKKLGLNCEKMGAVINSGTGRSHASEFFIPHILKGDFSNGYPMQHAYKDLISGADISTLHSIPTPVLAAATATYQQALLAGHGDKDKGGMIRVFEQLLGVEFRSK